MRPPSALITSWPSANEAICAGSTQAGSGVLKSSENCTGTSSLQPVATVAMPPLWITGVGVVGVLVVGVLVVAVSFGAGLSISQAPVPPPMASTATAAAAIHGQ